MSDYFGWVDYTVLIGMLILSTVIGLFFAWRDRNKNEDEYLRGGKHMSIIPVSISLVVSFMGSTTFIGFPTVVYMCGTQFFIMGVTIIIAGILANNIFIPVYYNMNLRSINEYLHKRFESKSLQVVANVSVLLAYIPFFSVELFAPAIALSIVTDMSVTASIFVIGVIVTLYTSLGGLKGVIWTDFFQFSVMMIGMLAVIIRGANVSGGMAKTFQKAHAGGRIEFWNMDFDIYQINSFWIYAIGFLILQTGSLSISQMTIQRAVCLPTLKSAQKAMNCAIPGFSLIMVLVCLAGVVMYARFYDCDPLLTGRVKRPDQLLPYFVLDIFEDDYKGFPGVFVASVFGSSLSTLSSGLNAMATIIWDDYAKKIFHRVPDKYNVIITRGLAAMVGVVAIALAFGIKQSDNIVEAAVSIYGASMGPVFGIFCLGLFFPWTNAIGCGSALIMGQVMCLWATIGWVSDKRDPRTLMLALSTEGCAAKNITVYMPGAPLSMLTDYKIPEYNPKGIDILHHMSPYFIPAFGFLISILVGNVVSLVTMGNKNRSIDPNLVNLKICYYLEKLLPQSWRQLQDAMTHQPLRRNDGLSDNKTTDMSCNGNDFELKKSENYFMKIETQDKDDNDFESELPLRSSQQIIEKTTNETQI